MATTTKNQLIPTGTTEIPIVGTVLLVDGLYSDAWEANAYRTEAKGEEACICCGKTVKPGRGFVVWSVEGAAGLAPIQNWPAMSDDLDGDWHAGNMGVGVLGSTCAKQIPTAYRARY